MSFTKKLPKDYFQPSGIYAGQRLRSLLESIYDASDDNFLGKIDEDLLEDGTLREVIYNSLISYLLRRLVAMSQHYDQKFSSVGAGRVRTEIRKHLSDFTRFDADAVQQITNDLVNCLESSNDDFSDSDKRMALNQVKQQQWGCYICGRDMDTVRHDKNESYKWATADHKWPKAFGGASELGNLRYACQDCNSKYKKDFIDATDYHFEEMSLFIADRQSYVLKARNRSYESAIFAKSDYRCTVCREPAYRVGELSLGRLDIADSWHFLNLAAYCQSHNPE